MREVWRLHVPRMRSPQPRAFLFLDARYEIRYARAIMEQKLVDALRWIVEILNRKNIPYQISGGLAAHFYGSKRPVNDIDIDIPEENLADIVHEIEAYIVTGPGHHVDGKWDLQLIALNYNGQDIDIGGAYETKVTTKDRTAWIAIPADLGSAQKIKVGDLSVNVASPQSMIAYKQHLDGEHQIEDIEAMQEYLARVH